MVQKKNSVSIADDTSQARECIWKKLQKRPMKSKDLEDVLKKNDIGSSNAARKRLVDQILKTLLREGHLFVHPKKGNKSVHYGATAPDPSEYISKSTLGNFPAIYNKLVKAAVPTHDILAAAIAKVDPHMTLPAMNGVTSSNQAWLEEVVSYLRHYREKHPTTDCPLPELYHEVVESHGVSLGMFHDGLRELAKQGRIKLLEWTQPLYTMKDERFALIAGKEIRYYARIA